MSISSLVGGSGPCHLLQHHVVQVDQPRRLGRPRVGPGQEQQVAHQPLHPVGLDPQRLHGTAASRWRRGALRRRRARCGSRSAGSAGRARRWPRSRAGGARRSRAGRASGSWSRPVAAPRRRCRARGTRRSRSRVGDLGDLGPDPLDRTQRPPDDQPDRAGEQREHQRQPEQQQPGQRDRSPPAPTRGWGRRRPSTGPSGVAARRRPEPVVLGLLVVGPAHGADDGRSRRRPERRRSGGARRRCSATRASTRAVVRDHLGDRVVADRRQHLGRAPAAARPARSVSRDRARSSSGRVRLRVQDRHQRAPTAASATAASRVAGTVARGPHRQAGISPALRVEPVARAAHRLQRVAPERLVDPHAGAGARRPRRCWGRPRRRSPRRGRGSRASTAPRPARRIRNSSSDELPWRQLDRRVAAPHPVGRGVQRRSPAAEHVGAAPRAAAHQRAEPRQQHQVARTAWPGSRRRRCPARAPRRRPRSWRSASGSGVQSPASREPRAQRRSRRRPGSITSSTSTSYGVLRRQPLALGAVAGATSTANPSASRPRRSARSSARRRRPRGSAWSTVARRALKAR